MWSEKFTLKDIREMDQIVRNVLNAVKAKYKLQSNASLYIPRNQGGRGLKNLEATYKRTKVATAMNLLTRADPRSECVRAFEKRRMEKGRSSVLTDAIKYSKEDFDFTFEPLENDFVAGYEENNERKETSQKQFVKSLMKKNYTKKLVNQLCNATWQGTIFNTRLTDNDIKINECFDWLKSWKNAPVDVINDFHSIYLQTVPTLTFKKYRGERNIISTTCRLCSTGNESVKHLLSNCTKFISNTFKRRHDRVLQYIMFKILHKYKLITDFPPWYTKVSIKPMYQNEEIEVFWDIPEYSGYDNDLEHRPLRPDGKIINKKTKKIHVLEMSIPWIENRNIKLVEKLDKYKEIIQSLKVDNPGFLVEQATFIIDCMGGYSKDLIDNLSSIGLTRNEIDSILPKIQRIVITEANATINRFKVLTMK